MTTIVLVRKAGSAVIAADSLTTFGTTRLAPGYDRHPHKDADQKSDQETKSGGITH